MSSLSSSTIFISSIAPIESPVKYGLDTLFFLHDAGRDDCFTDIVHEVFVDNNLISRYYQLQPQHWASFPK